MLLSLDVEESDTKEIQKMKIIDADGIRKINIMFVKDFILV